MDFSDATFVHLASLTADWNAEGACQIDGRALDTARGLQVIPTNEGGLQLELHTRDSDVEVEIAPNGRIKGVLFERA